MSGETEPQSTERKSLRRDDYWSMQREKEAVRRSRVKKEAWSRESRLEGR